MRAANYEFARRAPLAVALSALLIAASGCGSSATAPSSSSSGGGSSSGSSGTPGSSTGTAVNVTGTEKIGWNQAASGASQLAHYRYVGYVDGVGEVLTNASCGTAQTNGAFACTASLPKMTAGQHQFQIATEEVDGSRLASDRSAVLLLNVTGTRTVVAAMFLPNVTTYDGVQLAVETLAIGLAAPSAVAVPGDGRVFVAGRDGRILVWQNGKILPQPALQLADAAQSSDVGLVGLSLDNDFASNGRVFVAYAARDPNGGFVNRVMRLRDTNSVFVEPAVILEDRALVAPLYPARIRMAPDRTVYIAFPADNQAAAESYSSYAGKILRINADGTTPADNPGATPIVAAGEAVTAGFGWHPISKRLWVAGRDWHGRDVLKDFAKGADGAATFDSLVDPSGMAFYTPGRTGAFANDLFIGGLNGRHLRRVHFSAADASRVESTEHLLDGTVGRISDVAAGPDGALYVVTSNKGTTSAAPEDDRLIKLTAK